jgi:2-phosphosulfolactate phosphatase
MTPEAVKGRLVIITTTNGTGALLAVQGAAQVYCAAAANFSLAAAAAREIWARDRDMVILCAGRDHRFSLDDAYCAGRLASVALGGVRRRQGLNDAGLAALHLVRRYGERWERPLLSSRAGRELATIGLKHDVLDCARADAYPVLALFHERRVTAAST